MTVPKVQTVYVAGDRYYVDPGTGDRAPGVSGIVGMMPKPALPGWAAREAATFAVRNLAAVAALARTDEQAAIDLIKGAPWRQSGKAADVGTEVHGLTERLMVDRMAERRSEFRVPTGSMPYLRHFARFAVEFDVRPVLVETTVWNDEINYAGTLDALYELTLDGERVLAVVDTKTGASGVWPEASLQQVAYVRAPWYIDPANGERRPMIRTDRAFALWLRPDGFALIPLTVDDETWQQFCRLRESFKWKRERERYAVGKAVNANPIKRQWSGKR